jgi:hypothetical protein
MLAGAGSSPGMLAHHVTKALSSPGTHHPAGEAAHMDGTAIADTLVVAWVLGCALYSFWLGRAMGASGWPRRE